MSPISPIVNDININISNSCNDCCDSEQQTCCCFSKKASTPKTVEKTQISSVHPLKTIEQKIESPIPRQNLNWDVVLTHYNTDIEMKFDTESESKEFNDVLPDPTITKVDDIKKRRFCVIM